MISKTALQAHYSCSMEKNGFKKSLCSKNEAILKISHHAISFAKSPVGKACSSYFDFPNLYDFDGANSQKIQIHALYFVLTYEKCVVFSLLVSQASVVNIRLWGTKTRIMTTFWPFKRLSPRKWSKIGSFGVWEV